MLMTYAVQHTVVYELRDLPIYTVFNETKYDPAGLESRISHVTSRENRCRRVQSVSHNDIEMRNRRCAERDKIILSAPKSSLCMLTAMF
jgi:hypothetical protein